MSSTLFTTSNQFLKEIGNKMASIKCDNPLHILFVHFSSSNSPGFESYLMMLLRKIKPSNHTFYSMSANHLSSRSCSAVGLMFGSIVRHRLMKATACSESQASMVTASGLMQASRDLHSPCGRRIFPSMMLSFLVSGFITTCHFDQRIRFASKIAPGNQDEMTQ